MLKDLYGFIFSFFSLRRSDAARKLNFLETEGL
jgi:hypothetical protein